MASVKEVAPDGETWSWSGWPVAVCSVEVDDDDPTRTTAVAGMVTRESLSSVSADALDDGAVDGVPPECAGVPPELPEWQAAVSAATASAIAALWLLRSSPPELRSTYLVGVTVTVPERPALFVVSPAM
jgi:hypothetical protein